MSLQQFYFIEITRMSGMKTYVGWKMEEIFNALYKIPADLGFKSEEEAARKIELVAEKLKSSGTIYSSLNIINVNT